MANPSDCAPDDPRIDADLSDFNEWDPEVRFSPDDASKPRGAGVAVDTIMDSGSLDDQLALEAELKRRRKEIHSDTQPFWSQAANPVRIPQELFRSLERYTNIPFYGWFRRIEDAIDDTEQATTDSLKELRILAQQLRGTGGLLKGNREERKMVQRLFEEQLRDPEAAKALEAKLPGSVVEATTQLKGIYNRYFAEQGLTQTDVDDFVKAFRLVRERDGDYIAFRDSSKIPKIMLGMENAFKTGEVMLDNREWDFYAIGERLIRAHARQTHLAPHWNLVRAQVDAYQAEGLVSKELLDYFHSYTDQVRHAPDHWQVSFGRFMNKTTQQLFGKKLTNAETMDLVPGFLSVNYFANMAWNTGVAARNFLQPLVTSYPRLGERFTWEGYQAAGRAMRNVKELQRYQKLGVITRDVEPIQSSAIREAMTSHSSGPAGGTAATDFWNWFRDAGWFMFRSAENTNRIMSYQGMVNKVTYHGEQYLKKKITWSQFVERSTLDAMDKPGGPIEQSIKQVLDTGDLERTAHRMGLQFVRESQFVYRRGNTPYVMQGTVGRLFGQYGTWPAWYASYMSNMVMRGSMKNRAVQLSRWTAANAAVYYGASEVFGVEMGRWTFFSPLGYAGGPFVEISKNALSAVQVGMGSTDPVDRIQASRLASAYTQVVPFVPWGAGRNMRDAFNAAVDEDWKTATKRFVGFSPTEETK